MDGNPCVYKDNVLKWERGRLLAAYGDNMCSYDHDGVRYYFRKATLRVYSTQTVILLLVTFMTPGETTLCTIQTAT